jgi:hypothetical protein
MRAVVAACLCIGGCAFTQPPAPTAKSAPLRAGEILSAQSAKEALSVGRSTKADARAEIGEAVVIDFESGYEVWVYKERLREKATPPATELVLLFAPSGILAKARIR